MRRITEQTRTQIENKTTPLADGTGVTSNGIFIGNGRTDGTNYVIIQQFSKNRKAVILRTYQDYSTQTALLKIKFLGTKTTA